jgi:uncharacterized RDD family membrane protein YckC
MKSRFEPDVDSSVSQPASSRLIDPEAYDASEQRFAASVEEKPGPPRFVVDVVQDALSNSRVGDVTSQAENGESGPGQAPDELPTAPASPLVTETELETVPPDPSLQSDLLEPPNSGSWRNEVAARVNNYRARRRPRAPHYPSLQLKFEPPEPLWNAQESTIQPAALPISGQLAIAVHDAVVVPQEEQPSETGIGDTGARILEFPRSALSPPRVFDELAEPVLDRPRILEVAELELPPPALGGILMEPVEGPAQERRPGFELPLQAAPMSKRLLAGAIDLLLVVTALAIFGYIFFRITALVPALQQAMGVTVGLVALFWVAYQYLLLVYTETTPGLKVAHLRLSRFDGTAVPRSIRRWRVLASILSGLSLALGYAWCFLDEDRLCWHDRITRTYMAPQKPPVTDSASPLC